MSQFDFEAQPAAPILAQRRRRPLRWLPLALVAICVLAASVGGAIWWNHNRPINVLDRRYEELKSQRDREVDKLRSLEAAWKKEPDAHKRQPLLVEMIQLSERVQGIEWLMINVVDECIAANGGKRDIDKRRANGLVYSDTLWQVDEWKREEDKRSGINGNWHRP